MMTSELTKKMGADTQLIEVYSQNMASADLLVLASTLLEHAETLSEEQSRTEREIARIKNETAERIADLQEIADKWESKAKKMDKLHMLCKQRARDIEKVS